jgi:hypothetical protein
MQGGRRAARIQRLPQSEILKNTGFVDMMIAKVLPYICFSLNQPPKSADDWYFGIWKNIIKTCEYVGIFCFPVSFVFPCNLTRCLVGDFDMIFITVFKVQHKLYIASRSRLGGPPPPPPRKNQETQQTKK